MKILFSWIGSKDITNANDNKPAAIVTAATNSSFSKIVLLNNYPKDSINGFLKYLKTKTNAEIDCTQIKLNSPINHEEIFKEVTTLLKKYKENYQDAEFYFHLSPGTPAMHAVWLLIAKTQYKAKLIQTTEDGVLNFVELPFNIALEFIPQIYKKSETILKPLSLTEFYEDPDFENIFFKSEEMVKLFNGAIKIARLEFPVLIQGKTGTGKEVLANLIHKKSNRKDKPFVAINCGAIPKDLVESELFGYVKGAFTGAVSDKAGFFEIASGGTIFLDEIAELPLNSQVKILRVLNDGTFNKVGSSSGTKTNVRIIAATHKNLIKQVEKGEFREDLFYRLSVLNLEIKPLRERKSDLKYLIDVISKGLFNSLQSNNLITAKEFSEASIKVLMEHEWSGNVRELINTLTRIIVLSESSIIQSEFTGSQLIHRSVIGAVNEENSMNIHRKISTVFTETYNRIKSKTTKKTEIARLMGFENYQTLDSWYNKYYITEKSSDL